MDLLCDAFVAEQILPRLPFKYVLRFGATSRRHNAIVLSAEFHARYWQRARSGVFLQAFGLGAADPVPVPRFLTGTSASGSSVPGADLAFMPAATAREEAYLHRLGAPPGPSLVVVHSAAGLLLCSRGRVHPAHYYVCNPVTWQWAALPELPCPSSQPQYGVLTVDAHALPGGALQRTEPLAEAGVQGRRAAPGPPGVLLRHGPVGGEAALVPALRRGGSLPAAYASPDRPRLLDPGRRRRPCRRVRRREARRRHGLPPKADVVSRGSFEPRIPPPLPTGGAPDPAAGASLGSGGLRRLCRRPSPARMDPGSPTTFGVYLLDLPPGGHPFHRAVGRRRDGTLLYAHLGFGSASSELQVWHMRLRDGGKGAWELAHQISVKELLRRNPHVGAAVLQMQHSRGSEVSARRDDGLFSPLGFHPTRHDVVFLAVPWAVAAYSMELGTVNLECTLDDGYLLGPYDLFQYEHPPCPVQIPAIKSSDIPESLRAPLPSPELLLLDEVATCSCALLPRRRSQ
ncbi:unnamed protein product [Urochloa decumbens]|uniref:Uncharacterized protein n=1 Tax=Urochloa decumbens TaxID=240449 RepID=A0ABC8YQD7_9POAL